MIDYGAAIVTIIIMTIFLLLLLRGGYISYWLIRKVFLNDKTIIIVPSFFFFNFGLLFFICTLGLTIIFADTMLTGPYKINNAAIIMPLLIILTCICFWGSFFSFSIFEDEKIICRNIFHIHKKTFNYSDIIKVKVYIQYHNMYLTLNRLRYVIELKDRTKIDINTLQLHKRQIKDKRGTISLKKILLIESKIGRYVPHTITSDAYHELNSSYINLTDDFHKRFKNKITSN